MNTLSKLLATASVGLLMAGSIRTSHAQFTGPGDFVAPSLCYTGFGWPDGQSMAVPALVVGQSIL
jgi:hypothetical protein